jgi:hypothetical protein
MSKKVLYRASCVTLITLKGYEGDFVITPSLPEKHGLSEVVARGKRGAIEAVNVKDHQLGSGVQLLVEDGSVYTTERSKITTVHLQHQPVERKTGAHVLVVIEVAPGTEVEY